MAVLQYRQGVYDPTSARLQKLRYADAAGKAAAIRGLIAEEASGPAVVETLLMRQRLRSYRAPWRREQWRRRSTAAPSSREQDAYAQPATAALAEALKDRDPTARACGERAELTRGSRQRRALRILYSRHELPPGAPDDR